MIDKEFQKAPKYFTIPCRSSSHDHSTIDRDVVVDMDNLNNLTHYSYGSCHDMGYRDILLVVLFEGFEVQQQS